MSFIEDEIKWIAKSKADFEVNTLRFNLSDQLYQKWLSMLDIENDSEYNRGYADALSYAFHLVRGK